MAEARVTQIVNLTLLAPDIQEKILSLLKSTTRDGYLPEHNLRKALSVDVWTEQMRLVRSLEGDHERTLNPRYALRS